jgi:hypothetical protein
MYVSEIASARHKTCGVDSKNAIKRSMWDQPQGSSLDVGDILQVLEEGKRGLCDDVEDTHSSLAET